MQNTQLCFHSIYMLHSSILSAFEVYVKFHFNKYHCNVQFSKREYSQVPKHMKSEEDSLILFYWLGYSNLY